MTERILTSSGTPLAVAGQPDSPYALLVLQEAFGVNDHIRAVTDYYATQGFYAVAPELFHRVGSPEVAYDDFPAAMEALATLSAAGLHDDLEAAATFCQQSGYTTASIGVVGFCMGGAVALYTATLGLVGAASTFYGGGVEHGRFGLPPLLELAPQLRCPWLGLYGDLDKGIPVEQVEALRLATATALPHTELVRYADADHGFNCTERPTVYNEAAARNATERTLAFFATTLQTR